MLQILVALVAGGAAALPVDGLLVPRSPYPDYLISEMWVNTIMGEVVLTGCATEDTGDGHRIPSVWLEMTLSFTGDTLSIDTLAISADTLPVLAASRTEEWSCLSQVTLWRVNGSNTLTLSWNNTSAPGLYGGWSLVTSESVDWRVYSHTCAKTVLGLDGDPSIFFWSPSTDRTAMTPALQPMIGPPGEQLPGFHAGPSLAFMQVPQEELDPIPPFSGEFPGSGLDPHHLAFGYMVLTDGRSFPAVICLDVAGEPVWKLLLDELAGGEAEYMGSIYYGGEFSWLVAGTIRDDAVSSDNSIFLAVIDDQGGIVNTIKTPSGWMLEKIAAVYDLILLSVIRDIPDASYSQPFRELYMFDLAKPPWLLSSH